MLLITQRLLNLKTPTIQDNFTIKCFLHVICTVLSIDPFPCFALLFLYFLNFKNFTEIFNQRSKVLVRPIEKQNKTKNLQVPTFLKVKF